MRFTDRTLEVHMKRIVLATALLVLAAGCGKEATGAIDAEFRARVNKVCEGARARHEGQEPFPVKNFDRENPDPEQLAVVGAYFDRYDDTQKTVEELTALGEPRTGQREWAELLDAVRRAAENSRVQRETAKAKNVSEFVRIVHEGDDLHERIGKLGPAAGFPASSACGKYHGAE